MNVQVVNQFLVAAKTVLNDYFSLPVSPAGKPSAIPVSTPMEAVTVVLELTGDLEGQFIVSYSHQVALNIARKMIGNPDYPQFDDMCRSALAELTNMIAGTTSTGLADLGYACSLAPPMVYTNTAHPLEFTVDKLLSVPLVSEVGNFKVLVGLKPSEGE